MTATAPAQIEQAMRHALSLAAHGPAWGVNPQVGCVLLTADGTVLAEGWHRGAGTAHAEVDALSKLSPGEAVGATAVVTLEPCNHTGRTDPCSEALLAAGVSEVYYSVADPGARSGGGGERLREGGVAVHGGLLAEETERAMRVWLTAERGRRPYVSVKWASSLDGRAAASDGSSQWITGTAARQRVHEQRETADAIVVGTGTVLADDPSLTARGDAGELMPHQPVPVIIGERSIPEDARLFQHPGPVILTASRDLPAILDALFERDIRHVYVEGGPTLASAFVAAGLVDEYLIYLAPTLLGGAKLALGDLGVPTLSGAHALHIESIEQLGDDLLITAYPKAPTLPHHDRER
ncbi:bifunctional diaminohydroxyphosphoribosylaminopyrimidine deaminase/5-amino-6-(5-phosphoribosylamino)uracil reductase RibD [Lacisediminihabitans changchengi]|uniref:Riboflavin biosynthesis protein RibD n=1 Tax=Lacisediminihabitans changchengi TaxID=2787634 RepID=A0A934SNU8_9MICO|nr:bifunctional diaminohydroxyphosphoribosylaminopyrimidine deaminase/5-amino-6-(5-phosphoribosylamino)uracil reductase RibD [Lacisediminihabitans changchengi]MBK4348850.1 bifunctional diaminohydroxyphosphoribosylaminopyrimidine deaminase/5-amino-6-(5-phosphoribosylamino)uracil reductase RibD [Lacisediminihabitans changchengi]